MRDARTPAYPADPLSVPPERAARWFGWVGIFLLCVSVICNEWLLGAIYAEDATLGVRRFAGEWSRVVGIQYQPIDVRWFVRGAQALLVLGGVGLIAVRRPFGRVVAKFLNTPFGVRTRAAARWLVPLLDRITLLALIPIAVCVLLLGVLVFQTEGLSLLHLLPWLYLAKKLAVDASVFLLMLFVAFRLPAQPWPAVAITIFFLGLYVTDVMMYDNARTLFERQYLVNWEPGRVAGFFRGRAVGWVVLMGTSFAVTIALLPRLRKRLTWRVVVGCLAVLFVLEIMNLPRGIVRVTAIPLPYLRKQVYLETLAPDLAYLARNPFLAFAGEMFSGPPDDDFRIAEQVEGFRELIDELGLQILPIPLEPLHLKPFRRVVLIPVESLALDTLAPYNPNLPTAISPFYASDRVRQHLLTRYYPSRWPTINGLLATFNSHVNVEMLQHFGSPDSLVKILRDQGFVTIFMLTQEKRYQKMDEFARDQGFDILVSKEDFAAAGLDPKYMQEWGVLDQFLYAEAVEQLAAHRDDKVFLTILGCDTHTPSGRLEYHDVPYPPLPDFIENAKPNELKMWLQSIFYHDRDMARFMTQLDEVGLWDDETLLIITADHAPPFNFVLRGLPGYPNTNLARIPLVLLTPQELPAIRVDLPAGQLDLAPTLLHLLGIPAPPGWWGRSIFAGERQDGYVGVDHRLLILRRGESVWRVDLDSPSDARAEAIVELYNTLWRAPKSAGAAPNGP